VAAPQGRKPLKTGGPFYPNRPLKLRCVGECPDQVAE